MWAWNYSLSVASILPGVRGIKRATDPAAGSVSPVLPIDSNPKPWYVQADSSRDQTLYYVQNWRADVVALLNESGRAEEHVRYTVYGSPRRFLTSPIDIAYDDGTLLPPLGSPNAALRNNGCVPLIRPCGSMLVARRTSQHTDPQSRISGTKAINATHPSARRYWNGRGWTTERKRSKANADHHATAGRTLPCLSIICFSAKSTYLFAWASSSIDYSGYIRFELIGYDKVLVTVDLYRNQVPDYEAYVDSTVAYAYASKSSGPGLLNLNLPMSKFFCTVIHAPTPAKCPGSCNSSPIPPEDVWIR